MAIWDSTIGDLIQELVKIGKGAHIFKVDVSRAFRHLNIDPRDYDLLGVNWGVTYIDTRNRHGSQFFQRTRMRCVTSCVSVTSTS